MSAFAVCWDVKVSARVYVQFSTIGTCILGKVTCNQKICSFNHRCRIILQHITTQSTTSQHRTLDATHALSRGLQCVTAAVAQADMEDDEVLSRALDERAGKPAAADAAAGHGMPLSSSGVEGRIAEGHEPQPLRHASTTDKVAANNAGLIGPESATSHLPFVAPANFLRVSRSSRPSTAAARDLTPSPSPMTPLDREQIEGLVSNDGTHAATLLCGIRCAGTCLQPSQLAVSYASEQRIAGCAIPRQQSIPPDLRKHLG